MLKPRPLLRVPGDVNFRLTRLLNIFYWISLFISLTGTILSNGYFIFPLGLGSLKKQMTEQAHLCLVMSVSKANVLIKRFTNVTICSIQIHFFVPVLRLKRVYYSQLHANISNWLSSSHHFESFTVATMTWLIVMEYLSQVTTDMFHLS